MAGSRRLTIEIAGDAKGAGRAFDTVNEDAKGMGSKLSGVAKVAGVALAGIGIGALAMIPSILETGGKLESLGKKAQTVFEDSLGSVQAWGQANAAAMGLTTREATGLAAGIGDLLKPMGFTAKQAAGMSTDLLNLSGALSAWTGGQIDAAGVSDVITKAMLGERDGLKALGISISEAEVNAVLAAKGQDKLTGAALAQAKALATQQLILEKSTDAQKAWADGSMDSMKAQNESKASLAQLKETLISAVYPALQGLVPVVASVAAALMGAFGWLSDHKPVLIAIAAVIGVGLVAAFIGWATAAAAAAAATLAAAAPIIAIGAAVAALAAGVIYAYTHWDWFKTSVDAVKKFIVDDLIPAFEAAWGFIRDKLIPIIATAIEVYLKPLVLAFDAIKWVITNAVIPALSAVWSFIQGNVLPIFGAIGSTIVEVGGTVGRVVGEVVGFITGIPGRISAVVSTMWNGLTGGITTAKDWISDRIDEVVGFALNLPYRMFGIFDGMWDGIKGAFKSALNWVIRAWNSLEFTMPKLNLGPLGSIGGWTVGVPDIPTFHQGGTVDFGAAGQGLAMLRNDETVVTPEQKASMGGIVVNIYPQGHVMIERDLVRAVTDGIIDAQARGEIPVGAFR